MLYLDNSATTQVHPEVVEAMLPYLYNEFGNPSSKYYSLAVNAKNAVNTARSQVAELVGCDPSEVIFTSGSTESNNMIIKGVADFNSNNKHIITTKVEHPSVLETCKYLEAMGYRITYLNVDKYGRIDINELKKIIIEDTPLLVSIIWGNNEVGSLNDIKATANLCEEYNILFHTDATQVMGKIRVNLGEIPGIRFLSLSAHKMHGPKGVGACIIKKDESGLKTKLTPLFHGGEQEEGYRSGTLAVHNIVGLGKASELTNQNLKTNIEKLNELEAELCKILNNRFQDNIIYNNDTADKIPGLLSVQFKGVNNELLIKELAPHIALSTGSACSSSKPSHVLSAMNFDLNQIRETIRITLEPNIHLNELKVFREL